MTEAQLQKATLDLARTFHWLIVRFPVTDVRIRANGESFRRKLAYDTKGFPDTTLVRRGYILYVEFKKEDGVISTEQRMWGEELSKGNGHSYRCWRPADWHSGAIEAALR